MPKKSKHKRHKKKYAISPEELLIREKSKKFLEAEREYWKARKNLLEKMEDATHLLGLKANELIPNDLSSIVWGLKDGVSFVRYKSVMSRPMSFWTKTTVCFGHFIGWFFRWDPPFFGLRG